MSKKNLISATFTPEEIQEAIGKVTSILDSLKGRCVNLTPDERREYNRIGIRTENWARKVVNYMIEQPQFIPAFVDFTETKMDFDAREALKPLLRALEAARDMFDDTIMALGADLYGSELGYYSNVRMMAGQNVIGAKSVYEDLAAQFPRNTRGKKDDTDEQES